MRLRLIPREQSFFDLFEQMGNEAQQGAQELLGLLRDHSDVDRKVGGSSEHRTDTSSPFGPRNHHYVSISLPKSSVRDVCQTN